ncbi:MAG: hypothetical protein ACW99G_17495 [Candidatus Thorarchaeota archaeon]|jgi:hypothetical protein
MPAITINNNDSNASLECGNDVTFVTSRTITITVQDEATNPISGVQVGVFRTSDRFEIMNEDTIGDGTATQGYSGANADIEIRARKASPSATKYKNFSTLGFIGSGNFSLLVTLIEDPINTS